MELQLARVREGGMGVGDGEAGLTGAAAAAIPGPRIYSCCNCRCHVADHDEIISKCFQVWNQRSFLLMNLIRFESSPLRARSLGYGSCQGSGGDCTVGRGLGQFWLVLL